MFTNVKINENNIKKPDIRYSQTSFNSTQNSDLDYNLYCFSQGYENKEKGFWRGVLRNKNIDFDLRFDKEWNRKIELEDDFNISETQSQISNVETDIISFVNESEIGWDKNLFQNFKKKQTGIKKQKNKEWLLSNGIKRAQNEFVELRTQNYKQFVENEQNKKLKKIQNEKDKEKTYQYKKQQQQLILDNTKYQLSEKTKKFGIGEYNLIKSYAGSDTKKTGSSTYNTYGQSDSKALTKNININKNQYGVKSSVELKQNKNYYGYQRSPRIESQTNYGVKRQEIKIGQNYNTNINKKLDDKYIQAFILEDRPKNLVRLEVSVEKKNKEKNEKKPEARKPVRITSNKKKREVSLDKYGKPITNTSRVNIDTSKKKAPKERLENRSSLEISVGKKKPRPERKTSSRKHTIYSSEKKKKRSVDSKGKPLTNTARLNIDTSTKKAPKERLENRTRLEISVGKKKPRPQKKTSSRKHKKYSSEKKKRISVDSQGKPLTNTSRKNIDTSTKKEPKERLENRSRLEISVGKKKPRPQKKTSSRKHKKYSSEKKKKISVDSQGRPLKNTSRVNIDTSTKKEPKKRLENRTSLEISFEGKKKQKPDIKPSSRKHHKISITKPRREESLDKDGKPLTNVSRLRVGIKEGKVEYAQIEDFDKYEDKSHQRHQVFQTESNIYTKPYNKPASKYTQMKTPVKNQETKKTNIVQHNRQLTGQLSTKKISEAGNAFFTTKYKYERIKKEDHQSNKATQKTQQSKGKESSYTNTRYEISTSKLNTANTNISEKKPRFDKGIDISKTSLFDNKKEQTQTNRNYSYNKDLITTNIKTNTSALTKQKTSANTNENKRGTSETKTFDFSKYYKNDKKEKPKQTIYQKPIDKINGNEIYEYVPISSSKQNYSNYSNSKQTQKKNQKEFSIDLTKYNKNQPQIIEISEETRSSENKRNRSSVPNQRFSFSQNSMAYFKLQFVTTKQVVDTFWKSIDNGELSISMFTNQQNSSKLSNYISPDKNRMSKISTSIGSSEFSKIKNSGNINKKINFSNSEINIGKIRQSYKV